MIICIDKFLLLFHPAVSLCVLCLTPTLLPAAVSCPPPCLCYSDGVVDCGGRGLSSLPPLHLLPPGSHSLVLANNKLASLGASAFSNFSTLEVRLQSFYCLVQVAVLLLLCSCASLTLRTACTHCNCDRRYFAVNLTLSQPAASVLSLECLEMLFSFSSLRAKNT